ncbi:MAG: chloride channel protein, partial [Burkholderia vietnamiensis]|nr:chloride channel protein [Burkholderia vietnamiensis]
INTPLAGIVFAIEELTRSFSARASGVLITAIILAGVVALGVNGNYTYFGTINAGQHFPKMLAVAVLVTAIVTGIAGGLFSWLLLNTGRWLPARLLVLYRERPIAFAALCGFVIAVVGIASGGTTFGSGYAEARGLLDGHEQLSVFYPFLKMVSMVGSYLPGIPGGIFAPSLSIGAGFGNLLHLAFGNMSLPMLIALAMVGYLAAVTQSPITSFVIVMEMINGHALVISLMATALVSSRIARFFAPPLYETLAERYLAPPAAAPSATAPAAAAAAAAATAASGVPEPQDAPADPLDTLREEDGDAEVATQAQSPSSGSAPAAGHDATPTSAARPDADSPASTAADPRDPQ